MSAESSAPTTIGPAFVLLLDAPLDVQTAGRFAEMCEALRAAAEQVIGLCPAVCWCATPSLGFRHSAVATPLEHHDRAPAPLDDASDALLQQIRRLSQERYGPVFLLPISFDFGLAHKEWVNAVVRTLQRREPALQVHYDAVDPAHPLLVHACVDGAVRALQATEARGPSDVALLLVASGTGDADTRAQSYRLLRLIWEQLGVARGDVAFVRHPLLPFPEQLALRAQEGRACICVAQFLWPSEHSTFARLIFRDMVGQLGLHRAALTEPIGEHPNVQAWLVQRMLTLHRAHRARIETRAPSAKHTPRTAALVHRARSTPLALTHFCEQAQEQSFGSAVVAELSTATELRALLQRLGVPRGRSIVKPTWHGYAPGTYTDPSALNLLLSALPERTIVTEGHTSSRNDGLSTREGDWEDGRELRVFIQDQDREFLARTGLLGVLRSHRASYLNVTEAFWDGQCAPPDQILAVLREHGVQLHYEELAGFVPRALFELRGAPLLSFARFKGPTRLSTANLFGLLPPPLRTAWHGPNIAYFARVCCDLAKLYGCLFQLYGIVESAHVAVRWERDGLYRSRWGNYDLVPRPGVLCLSAGTAAADVLAARLQGQDVTRSAFFDVVQAELGFDASLSHTPLPQTLVSRFA